MAANVPRRHLQQSGTDELFGPSSDIPRRNQKKTGEAKCGHQKSDEREDAACHSDLMPEAGISFPVSPDLRPNSENRSLLSPGRLPFQASCQPPCSGTR